MIVLGVSTVGPSAGVALLGPEGLRASGDLGERGRHAEALLPAVEELLGRARLFWTGLELLAVDVGPGSFTGIRVGVAFALGVAHARGLPAVGVGSLDILARACYDATGPQTGTYVIAGSDVRRGEAAVARFRVGPSGPVREEDDALVVTAQAGPPPGEGSLLAGDAATLLWPQVQNLRRWPGTGGERALAAARLGLEIHRAGAESPPEPRYARPPEARPRRRI